MVSSHETEPSLYLFSALGGRAPGACLQIILAAYSVGRPGLAGHSDHPSTSWHLEKRQSPGTWPSDDIVLTIEVVPVCLIGWAAGSPCRFKFPLISESTSRIIASHHAQLIGIHYEVHGPAIERTHVLGSHSPKFLRILPI